MRCAYPSDDCLIRGGLEQRKEIAQGIGQGRLVVLYRQYVVSTAMADRLGHVALGAYGVDRDDAASNARVASNSGMAVFSFDFWAVAR